jgi:RNA polymerase sigma-70 factor (family 1)
LQKRFYFASNRLPRLKFLMNENLLAAIAEGDEIAFKQLYERYRQKLFVYMLRITKSPKIAEEIVLDVFLKIWIGRELLKEIKALDAFLYKVAYNKAIDFFRITAKERNLQKLIQETMETSREREADYRILDNEYQLVLEKAIEQLSPQRRLIFNLSRNDGLSHEEIAQQLQISKNTVRNTIAETLKSIRHCLQKSGIHTTILLLALLGL